MIQTARRRAITAASTTSLSRPASTQSHPRVTVPAKPTWKHPTRGGQDLSQRYRRLEKSLRGKGLYQKDIVNLVDDAASASPAKPSHGQRTFMGYVIPEEPNAPGPEGEYELP